MKICNSWTSCNGEEHLIGLLSRVGVEMRLRVPSEPEILAMSRVWPWVVMRSHPPPNVQITTLSVMGLYQSSNFRCRARLHLDPVFAVSYVHCSDKQAISFRESSWQSPAFSAAQLRSALSGDQDWAKQGMLGLCTWANAWREESSGGRKGKWELEGNVQVADICYQKWKVVSFTKLPSVIFWEQVHHYFHSRAQAVFITLHYFSLTGPSWLQPERTCYSLSLPAK